MSTVTTPTAHTVNELRRLGWIADKVEQRLHIPGGRPVTRDAFGFGDILAAHPERGILLVQATSRPNISARIQKATSLDIPPSPAHPTTRPNHVRLNLLAWLHSGGRFEVWGWDKTTVPGKAHKKTARVRRIVFEIGHGLLSWTDQEGPP